MVVLEIPIFSIYQWKAKTTLFEGFVVGKDKVHVSILQFADHILLFCKYDDGMLNVLTKAIELFEWR